MRFHLLVAVVASTPFLSNPVVAQPRLDFQTVKTSGAIPAIQGEVSLSTREIYGFSMDQVDMRLHWVFKDQWHQLDLRSGEWTLQGIRNEFDLVAPRWGVVPGTKELRAWDDAVGRVVRIDANGVPTRIDRSFYHDNQFAHVSHVESNGTIHAVGGIGLFHPKNFSISFSEASNGWHRTSGNEDVTSDPYVSFGYALRDPMTSTLILATAYGIAEHPRSPGFLAMDLKSGVIRLLHADMDIVLEQGFRGVPSALMSSVGDGSHRIAFFLNSHTTPGSGRNSRILAMDLDTYRIIELEGANQGDTDPGTHHTVLHYNEVDSTLYSVQWSHHTIDMVNFVAVSKAKVDVPAIQAALKKGTPPDKSLARKRVSPPLWPWQAALGTALLLLVGMWVLCRRTPPSALPAAEPSTLLTVEVDPVRVNGTAWRELFSLNFTLEGQLLELLAHAMLDGRPVVSSDTVDRLLIPNHPSLDYIRKTRNLTRKRLEESLQSVHPLPSGECYIQTDRDVSDKRKTKLQLNPKWVSVTPTK